MFHRSVNPFSLYICVISNPDGQQHFLSQVSSAQPTTPQFITLQSDLRLPTALVSKVIYAVAVLQQMCFLFFVRSKRKSTFTFLYVCPNVMWSTDRVGSSSYATRNTEDTVRKNSLKIAQLI